MTEALQERVTIIEQSYSHLVKKTDIEHLATKDDLVRLEKRIGQIESKLDIALKNLQNSRATEIRDCVSSCQQLFGKGHSCLSCDQGGLSRST